MCIAIVNKSGTLPLETFTTSFRNNPDGIGIAFTDGGEVRTIRTMDAPERLYERYAEIRETNPHPILIHARIGTHGSKDLGNVHPFKVTRKLALIHNGIVSAPTYRKDRSDTWHLVDLLKRLRSPENALNPETPEYYWLKEFAGYTSKFALLHADGRTAIFNEQKGTWEGETWFSNGTHKPTCTTIDRGGRTYKGWDAWDGWETYTKSKSAKVYDMAPSKYEMAVTILRILDEPINGSIDQVINKAEFYAEGWSYKDLHALYTDAKTWGA